MIYSVFDTHFRLYICKVNWNKVIAVEFLFRAYINYKIALNNHLDYQNTRSSDGEGQKPEYQIRISDNLFL